MCSLEMPDQDTLRLVELMLEAEIYGGGFNGPVKKGSVKVGKEMGVAQLLGVFTEMDT